MNVLWLNERLGWDYLNTGITLYILKLLAKGIRKSQDPMRFDFLQKYGVENLIFRSKKGERTRRRKILKSDVSSSSY